MTIFGASVSAASVSDEASELATASALLGSAALTTPDVSTAADTDESPSEVEGATTTTTQLVVEDEVPLGEELAALRSVQADVADEEIEVLVEPSVSFAVQPDAAAEEAVEEPAPTTTTAAPTTTTTTAAPTTTTTTTAAPPTTTAAPAPTEQLTGTPTEQAVQLSAQLGNPGNEADAQAAWDRGYVLGGGGNLSSFHNTILPCESGGQADRDTVVGRTDDWGRAQINRPVWSSTFASMFGIAFETGVTQPVLNGFMAAHIEQVQGLSAWTCWRNR